MLWKLQINTAQNLRVTATAVVLLSIKAGLKKAFSREKSDRRFAN